MGSHRRRGGDCHDDGGASAFPADRRDGAIGIAAKLMSMAGIRANLVRLGRNPLAIFVAQSAPENRHVERYRRAFLSFVASGLRAGVGFLLNLVATPLLISHFGVDGYGIWATIFSFVGMLAFLDFGIGNGVMNTVAQCEGAGNLAEARRAVAGGLMATSLLAVILACVFLAAAPWFDWSHVFPAAPPALAAEGGAAIRVLALSLMLMIPLGLVPRIQSALQRAYVSSIWDILARFLAFFGFLVAIFFSGTLTWLVLSFVGAMALTQGLNGVVLFFQRPGLRPRWADVSRRSVARILRLSVLFFVLQLISGVNGSSDRFIISTVLGPAAVAQYAVLATLFQIVPMVIGMVLVPIWPAYTEALARGDVAWVRTTFLRTCWGAAGLSALLVGAILLVGSQFIQLWLHHQLTVDRHLMIAYAVWVVLLSTGNAMAMLLNAANVVTFQIIFAVAMGVVVTVARIVTLHLYGMTGFVWASVVVYTAVSFVPSLFYIRRRLLPGTRSERPIR